MIEKAEEMFTEYKAIHFVINKLFYEYEDLVDTVVSDYKQYIEIEKAEVELRRKRAIELIEKTISNIALVGFITIFTSVISGYFIASPISKSVKRLKLATVEVAKGNLDTLIESKSKDEVGDLAISFSHMTEDLKESKNNLPLARNYINNIFKSMSDTLVIISPKGRIITINSAACVMLEYEEHELVG